MKNVFDKRFWEDLTTLDFSNMDLEDCLAILPVAAIEQHGPHLPVKVDSTIINGIVEMIAKKLPRDSKAVFLPTQKIGKSNEHLAFPGTLSLSTETFFATIMDIGGCVASYGIKKLMLINSHGGNVSVLDTVTRELRVKHNMLVFNVNWFGLGMPEGVYSSEELKHGIHAGDMETSVMLALDPDNVRMTEVQNFVPKTIDIEKDFQHIGVNAGCKFGWQAQDLNQYGACGNAKLADAKKGEVTLEFATKRVLKVIEEIESLPSSLISDKTAY